LILDYRREFYLRSNEGQNQQTKTNGLSSGGGNRSDLHERPEGHSAHVNRRAKKGLGKVAPKEQVEKTARASFIASVEIYGSKAML
jgi:hypothetical protein